eukprot:Platyproteum_vivax@DN7106_c1_g1_i3.p1
MDPFGWLAAGQLGIDRTVIMGFTEASSGSQSSMPTIVNKIDSRVKIVSLKIHVTDMYKKHEKEEDNWTEDDIGKSVRTICDQAFLTLHFLHHLHLIGTDFDILKLQVRTVKNREWSRIQFNVMPLTKLEWEDPDVGEARMKEEKRQLGLIMMYVADPKMYEQSLAKSRFTFQSNFHYVTEDDALSLWAQMDKRHVPRKWMQLIPNFLLKTTLDFRSPQIMRILFMTETHDLEMLAVQRLEERNKQDGAWDAHYNWVTWQKANIEKTEYENVEFLLLLA